MTRQLVLMLLAFALLVSRAPAQESAPLDDVPAPPERLQSGESIDPDVTIVRGEKQTVVEYRVNGQLRAVKVIPDVGAPYYLADADGDGSLDSKRFPLAPDFLINQWVIFSW